MSDETLGETPPHGWISLPAFLAALLLVIAGLSGAWSVIDGRHGLAVTDRAHETIVRLERVLSSLKDLETGQRGFLLTADEAYLQPYNEALQRLGPDLQTLGGLDVDAAQLRRLVVERQDAAARTIAQFRESGSTSAIATMRTGAGKLAMDRVRSFVADAQARAAATVDVQELHDRTRLIPVEILAVGSTLGAIALIAWLAAKRRREQRTSNALLEGVLGFAPGSWVAGFQPARPPHEPVLVDHERPGAQCYRGIEHLGRAA